MERADLEQWKAREVARLLALLETERRYYQEIVAYIPVGILVLSSDLSVISSNRAIRKIFGLRGGEALRRVESLLPQEVLRQVPEVLRTGVATTGLWDRSPVLGMVFAALAVFFWLFFFYAKRHKGPVSTQTKSLWVAIFYTVLVFLFRIKDHKLVLIFFNDDLTIGLVFSVLSVALWVRYFFQRWKAKRAGV